ncbi:MAG: bacteriohemerythrin [Defluviitaleaceae bacterium]|nr:bacteriohemerythrin [Defluviitaleaceae bacterium]
MAWDESLNTGIEEIDTQHKQLIEHAENFFEKAGGNLAQSEINGMLVFLESYVLQHFSFEIALQREKSYPDVNAHERLHKYFIDDFNDLKDRIDSEGISREIIDEASKFLINWIIEHISLEDKKYAEHYLKA